MSLWHKDEGDAGAALASVFFYGLYMDPALRFKNGYPPAANRLAMLPGYSCVIGSRSTLVPCSGEIAWGVIARLSASAIASLYPPHSHAGYKPVEVTCFAAADGAAIPALTFACPPEAVGLEEPEYRYRLRTLSLSLGIPESYVERLGGPPSRS